MFPLTWLMQLFVSMSKIHFESKSQQDIAMRKIVACCSSLCQRYILKANHNAAARNNTGRNVVRLYVKDTFWKQITTAKQLQRRHFQLFVSMSKIHFESKSQQERIDRYHGKGCSSLCQRYILKANHNTWMMPMKTNSVVRLYVKDTFWKQITTYCVLFFRRNLLFVSMSKIHFESKSQRHKLKTIQKNCCSSLCQRYILKANHNACISAFAFKCCSSLCQRYILKANHNKVEVQQGNFFVVRLYVKDTFWKQITTETRLAINMWMLFVSMSKIHFESKSQQRMRCSQTSVCCSSLCQRYILKANHNQWHK